MKLLSLLTLVIAIFFMTSCSQKKSMKVLSYNQHGYKETYPIVYDYVPLTPVQNIKNIKPSEYHKNNL